jgi:hypothetical protein
MADKLDLAYSTIGAALSDDDIRDLVKKSTGVNLTDVVNERDPPKKKVQAVIDFLKCRGNQRWLLARVMSHTAVGQAVRQAIVDAFPETMVRLPKANDHVTPALGYLQRLLSVPFAPELKFKLRPIRRSFACMPKNVIALFVYKTLQECFLKLLFISNANEALLANRVDGLTPDLGSLADHIDRAVTQALQVLPELTVDSIAIKDEFVKLTQLAASLRAAATPENGNDIIDDIQRLVRKDLTQLNSDIFKTLQELSFDALTDELPLRINIRDSVEFQELVQAIRDVTATILARALKSRMWQDAEAEMSFISKCLLLPEDTADIADDWFAVREHIEWLAELEPDEGWADEARKYAREIEGELFQEKRTNDNVRLHFEAFRSWFKGPFLKIDDTTKIDFGSLHQMGGPFTKILDELGYDQRA